MPKQAPIALGDRFTAIDHAPNARTKRGIWKVTRITQKPGAIEHAQLVDEADATRTKALSIDALRDGRLFERLSQD